MEKMPNFTTFSILVLALVIYFSACLAPASCKQVRHGTTRKILFPKGSLLSITPTLFIPLLSDGDGGYGEAKSFDSEFRIELPFHVHLDMLGQGTSSTINSLLNIVPISPSTSNQYQWFRRSKKSFHELGRGWTLDTSNHTKSTMSKPHFPGKRLKRNVAAGSLLQDERFLILTKLEKLLDSFGWSSGRSCLLRMICEVHEFFSLPSNSRANYLDSDMHLHSGHRQQGQAQQKYYFGDYGLLGEMVTLLLSASKSSSATQKILLREHSQAETNGRNGNCSNYRAKCGKSIFSN